MSSQVFNVSLPFCQTVAILKLYSSALRLPLATETALIPLPLASSHPLLHLSSSTIAEICRPYMWTRFRYSEVAVSHRLCHHRWLHLWLRLWLPRCPLPSSPEFNNAGLRFLSLCLIGTPGELLHVGRVTLQWYPLCSVRAGVPAGIG